MNTFKLAWLVIFFSVLTFQISSFAVAAEMSEHQQKMIRQLDQLDQLDHMDFIAQNEKAYACINARDFTCADKSIVKAAKYAKNPKDKKILQSTRQMLASERRAQQTERDEDERLARAEREREEQEEQRFQQERQAQNSNDSGPGLFKSVLAIGVGAYVGNATKGYSPTQQSRAMESSMKAVLNNNADEFKSTSNQLIAERKQEHKAKMLKIQQQKDRAEAERKQAVEQHLRDDERNRKQNQVRQLHEQERQQSLARKQNELKQARKKAEEDATRIAAQREQERLQIQARKDQEQKQARLKEEKAAAKRAEQRAKTEAEAAEQRAKSEAETKYLNALTAGIRLVATKCPDGEGKYYATGKKPKIKPEVVGCIDVHFRAYCTGSVSYSSGTAHNFIGMAGCFGDTYDIAPKPPCKVDLVRIEVVKTVGCK